MYVRETEDTKGKDEQGNPDARTFPNKTLSESDRSLPEQMSKKHEH